MKTRVQLSLRISRAQDAALRHHAEMAGLGSRYQAGVRAFEAGLGVLVSGGRFDQPSDDCEIAAGLGELLARTVRLEALTDRVLYTASAAYAYSRRGVLRSETDSKMDQLIGDAAQDAYARQRELARGAQ